MQRHLIIAALLAAATTAGFAQTAASTVQRDVNQEKRIEQGLQNGTVTTREAALLQRDESRVDKMQAQALKDGKLSDAERAKLNAAQNKTSRDIATATHNGVNGNPLSASSQRMQADVQRDINQQKRIESGLQDGSLTKHEASKLERGQAKVDHKEYVAGRDGHVGAKEQKKVQRSENKQSDPSSARYSAYCPIPSPMRLVASGCANRSGSQPSTASNSAKAGLIASIRSATRTPHHQGPWTEVHGYPQPVAPRQITRKPLFAMPQ